tara:strand:- start:111 stop:1169 length:1059 start_codon:yes stop_codon:yes gene_type:complete
MNINIILDSEYICKKLSTQNGMRDLENLFMIMKKKSNIIIIQDKNQKIINNIIHQLIQELKKKDQIELTYAKTFITELAKGTNGYDFISEEVFDDNILDFVNSLKKKNYPIKIIISDKKINSDFECCTIEDSGKILDELENYSSKYTVTNNKELLEEAEKGKNIMNFSQYKDVLFNTFWCSDKITIVAKEFFDGAFNSDRPDLQNLNREKYAKGFKFLFDCLKNVQNFTKQKVNIEIITGLKHTKVHEFKSNQGEKIDELYKFLNELNDEINFKLKIIKWGAGNEKFVGEGHGRRIYSDYGGFDTGFMPFEMHEKNRISGEIFHKDTSFHWINKKSYIEWSKIGYILEQRPQ